MFNRTIKYRVIVTAAGLLTGLSLSAGAQETLSLKDKTVAVVVGFTPGGPPDVLGRAAADGFSKLLPGRPAAIVRNMPGAEGVVALNSVVNQAKPDGLTLVVGAGGNLDPLLNAESHAAYDPALLAYVGGLPSTVSVLLANRTARPRFNSKAAEPVVMGASNNLRTAMWGVVFGGAWLDWNVRWVFDYPGTSDMQLALLKSEVDMTTLTDESFIQSALSGGKFEIVFHTGRDKSVASRRPELANAPTLGDLTKGRRFSAVEEEAFRYWKNLGAVGTWIALPPGTPQSIVDAYRTAFRVLVDDQDFRARTKGSFPDGGYIAGADLAKMASELAHTSPQTLAYLGVLKANLQR